MSVIEQTAMDAADAAMMLRDAAESPSYRAQHITPEACRAIAAMLNELRRRRLRDAEQSRMGDWFWQSDTRQVAALVHHVVGGDRERTVEEVRRYYRDGRCNPAVYDAIEEVRSATHAVRRLG